MRPVRRAGWVWAEICACTHGHRGALCGTPRSAYPQPEPNATELPSSAPGRPGLVELQAAKGADLRHPLIVVAFHVQ